MSLQGAIAGELPGKKIVSGIAAVTTNLAVALGDKLQTIDSFQLSYATAQASGNAFAYGAISGTTLTITCLELDLTAGTTAANIHYTAIGEAPR